MAVDSFLNTILGKYADNPDIMVSLVLILICWAIGLFGVYIHFVGAENREKWFKLQHTDKFVLCLIVGIISGVISLFAFFCYIFFWYILNWATTFPATTDVTFNRILLFVMAFVYPLFISKISNKSDDPFSYIAEFWRIKNAITFIVVMIPLISIMISIKIDDMLLGFASLLLLIVVAVVARVVHKRLNRKKKKS